ncbi:outer membrane protein assembly factor BamB family protein [Natranaeroarchaeum sulfidigenes]|uniref:ABC-type branched-chain amino acid transport system, periplasmic component n=1 Tax=Natranaeroarchaeum sulfidigenes TaxID=2784880 RepID=A0A897MRD9_9EURY|nr:PQQ-binding-like beta-propeller repeat protein [Natranaeroarchaeum sulfidigenes]QSG02992.1 ABC-type branched-chain amino acid transport system, periplasmic component [Natranaeroarchaeum sulfidigenes]
MDRRSSRPKTEHRRREFLGVATIPLLGGVAGCMQPLLEESEADQNDGGPSDDGSDDDSDGANGDDESGDDLEDVSGFEVVWEEAFLEGAESLDDHVRFDRSPMQVFEDLLYAVTREGALVGVDPDALQIETVLEGAVEPTTGSLDGFLFEDDRIYVQSTHSVEDNGVVCQLSSEGELRWTHEMHEDMTTIGAVATDGDQVFVGSHTTGDVDGGSRFEVLNSNGQEVFTEMWPEEESVNAFTDFFVHDGIVYMGELNNQLAYDIDAGEIVDPEEEFGMSIGQDHTVVNGTVYTVDGGLRGYDLDSGEELISADVGGSEPPVVVDEHILVAGETGMYAYNRETGEELWHHRLTGDPEHPPAVIDGVAYLLDNADVLSALHIETGEVLYDDQFVDSSTDEEFSTSHLEPYDTQLVFVDADGLKSVEPQFP